MNLQMLAAQLGLSTDHCLSLLHRVYAFESTLSPIEVQAIVKLINNASAMPPDKRQELQQFLHSQVAAQGSGPSAGVCVSMATQRGH